MEEPNISEATYGWEEFARYLSEEGVIPQRQAEAYMLKRTILHFLEKR